MRCREKTCITWLVRRMWLPVLLSRLSTMLAMPTTRASRILVMCSVFFWTSVFRSVLYRLTVARYLFSAVRSTSSSI